jgi:hypothetical protein
VSAVALCLDRRTQDRVAAEATASGHLVSVRVGGGKELVNTHHDKRVDVAVVGRSQARQ